MSIIQLTKDTAFGRHMSHAVAEFFEPHMGVVFLKQDNDNYKKMRRVVITGVLYGEILVSDKKTGETFLMQPEDVLELLERRKI